MKLRCAFNAAIKNVKIARKKFNFFSKIFSTKSPFFKKIQNFRKYKVYFQILEVLSVILTTYLPVWSNNKAMNQLFPTSCRIHEKL